MLEADLDVGDDGDAVSSASTFSAPSNDRDSSFDRGPLLAGSDGAAEELAAADPGSLGRLTFPRFDGHLNYGL
jgi:hypothetical protein